MSDEPSPAENRIRIDQPHPVGRTATKPPGSPPAVASIGRSASSAASAAASSEVSSADAMQVVQSVRNQASQLASHLQAMRKDCDRRESELNARIAKTESELRSARLWLQERQRELDGRAEELDERERKASEAEAALENAVNDRQLSKSADTELSENIRDAVRELQEQRHRQEIELRQQRQQIDLRRRASVQLAEQLLQGVERRRKAVEQDYQQRQQQLRKLKQESFEADYQKALEHFGLREQHLDEAEAVLTDAQADLEVQREQLKSQRQRSEQQQRRSRTQLAERQRELEAEWQRRQEALARRSEHLDSREAALRHSRQEVTALHREALELRLATQQLWSKLTDAIAAPALATELGRIRRRLAESFSMERNAALEAKHELMAAQKDLADQYVKLQGEKQDLHEWVSRRELEIEQQAARLVAREHELDRLENDQRELLRQWENDRRDCQDRIRRLTKQIRRDQPPQPSRDAAA